MKYLMSTHLTLEVAESGVEHLRQVMEKAALEGIEAAIRRNGLEWSELQDVLFSVSTTAVPIPELRRSEAA